MNFGPKKTTLLFLFLSKSTNLCCNSSKLIPNNTQNHTDNEDDLPKLDQGPSRLGSFEQDVDFAFPSLNNSYFKESNALLGSPDLNSHEPMQLRPASPDTSSTDFKINEPHILELAESAEISHPLPPHLLLTSLWLSD